MANPFSELPENPFADLPASAEAPSGALMTMEAIGQIVPALEVGAREASGLIGTSVGGLAGLGTLAANKLGLTNADPTKVINNVASLLTYQPQTDLGQHLGRAVDYPFEKLGELGQAAGEKVLEATGSPAAATGAQVGTQLLPLLAVPAGKRAGRLLESEKPLPGEVKTFVEQKTPADVIEQAQTADFTARESAGLGPVDKAVNINLQYIESTEDVKNAIRQTGQLFRSEIDDARRGVITNEQTEALADSLGMTTDKLLSRRKGQAFNAEEALASRKLLVDSASDLSTKAKAAIGGTDEALLSFQEALNKHAAIQQQVSGMTAEAGRALQQFKIKVKEEKARSQAIRELLEKQGGREGVENLAQAIADLDSPSKLNAFVDGITRSKASDVFLEAWINGLLSGQQTHAVNLVSNAVTALWTVPEQLTAAGLGKLHRGQKVTVRDALSRTYGLTEGLKDGIIAGGKAFLTEEPSDLLSKIETANPKAISAEGLGLTGKAGKAVDIAGKTIRIPGRALMGEDEFFKAIGYRMELNQLAMRQALNEGLKGDELSRRVVEIKRNPPEDMQLQALDAARYQTFTKPLGATGRSIIHAANSHPAIRLIAPFIRTPTNILKFAGERTPLAVLSKNVRDEIKKGGVARDVALSKIALGSGVAATVASMAGEGLISGGGPSDPGAVALLRAKGWQPYSIKVGNEWVSYSRIEPLGVLLGVAADYSDIAGELSKGARDDIASRIVSAISQNVTSKTWLRGLSDLTEMLNDPDRYGKRWAQKYVGTLIPTGVAQVARTQDPVLREVETTLDALKARIPGYSKTLPARRNVWGQPIILSGGIGPDLISPFYTSKEQVDLTTDEMLRLGINVGPPSNKIKGIELTPELHQRYVELAGKAAKQALDAAISMPFDIAGYSAETLRPEWEQLPDLAKEKFIRSIFNKTREAARVQLVSENPGFFNKQSEPENDFSKLQEAIQ